MKKFFLSLMTIALSVSVSAESISIGCGHKVRMIASPAEGYHFVRWSDGDTENPRTLSPTEDVHFTAVFAINQYTIVFQNEDGTILETLTPNHGATVSYSGPTPTKSSTAQYEYTFDSWSPNVNYTATSNATYTAQFTATLRRYTITFKNYDSTILQSSQWDYGTTPSYTGETPTKPADAANTYTFTGWSATISPVTGEAEYTAQYSNATNSYLLTVTGDSNGSVTGSGTYQYGQSVTITATPNGCYVFDQWNDGDKNASRSVTIQGNITYTAHFKLIMYTVTLEPDDAHNGSVSVEAIP